MAEKYPGLSPYTYVANNPVRFIDPDGREIVDPNGKPITYSAETGWASNATADVIKIGNAMLYTETGTKMLNAMVNSKVKIKLELSSDIRTNSKGNPVRGVTEYTDYGAKDSDGNYEIKCIHPRNPCVLG